METKTVASGLRRRCGEPGCAAFAVSFRNQLCETTRCGWFGGPADTYRTFAPTGMQFAFCAEHDRPVDDIAP